DRVEVFVANRREEPNPHATVPLEAGRDHVTPAIDRDVVATFDESCTELLGERLEAAIRGGHATGAEDGDLHRPIVADTSPPTSGAASWRRNPVLRSAQCRS